MLRISEIVLDFAQLLGMYNILKDSFSSITFWELTRPTGPHKKTKASKTQHCSGVTNLGSSLNPHIRHILAVLKSP